MSRRRRRSFFQKLWSMYLWHRYAGLVAALFVVHMAITGILLNHAHELELDQRYVSYRWLLNIYNIQPPAEIRGFNLSGKWVTDNGNSIYINDLAVTKNDSQLITALPLAENLIIVLQQELLLIDPTGIVIENIPNPSPDGAPIIAAGIQNNGDLIIAAGARLLSTDPDMLYWNETDSTPPETVQRVPLPPELQSKLSEIFLFTTLTWERVLQDAHAGRIAGNTGRLFFDLIGLLLILLAISGIIVWLQRLAAQRERDSHE